LTGCKKKISSGFEPGTSGINAQEHNRNYRQLLHTLKVELSASDVLFQQRKHSSSPKRSLSDTIMAHY
jgi:hypothetical protein